MKQEQRELAARQLLGLSHEQPMVRNYAPPKYDPWAVSVEIEFKRQYVLNRASAASDSRDGAATAHQAERAWNELKRQNGAKPQ